MAETLLFSFKFCFKKDDFIVHVIDIFFLVDILGEVAVDVNILNVGSRNQNYQIFIC
jgi:hypothetical protein